MQGFQLTGLALLLGQMATILLVSRALGLASRAVGQPLVVAEIAAGILLGPSLLGWVWPGGLGALFPPASLPALKVVSGLGVVLFMFMVGLQVDLRLLRGRARASIAIALAGIGATFASGAAAAIGLRAAYAPELPVLPFAAFIGAALSITAFPVLARILAENHLLSTRLGATAIASAAMVDAIVWSLLAFILASARAAGIDQALWRTAFAAAFIAAMWGLVRPFLARLGERVADREGLAPEVVFAVLLVLLASSTISEWLGLHALFGAFLAGAVMPRGGELAEALADRLETVAVRLLVPLFFAYSGLRTEILALAPADWAATAGLVLLATAGKLGASAVAARLSGFGWRDAGALGALLNTRGLMILIALNVGLDVGLIPPAVFTMLVIVALGTTLTASPVLRWLRASSAPAALAGAEPERPSHGATPFTVLACVSDRTRGEAMAHLASALAAPEPTSRVLALHLVRPPERPTPLRRPDPVASGPLAPFLEGARALALDVRPLSFVSGDAVADICMTAEAKGASVILLGGHRPLLMEGRLGGTVAGVVARAPAPVAVLFDRGARPIRRVLVGSSDGPEDAAALRVARRLALGPGGTLVQHAAAPPGAAGVAAILEEAARGYDLLVLGMSAAWGLEPGALGGRRERILADTPCSVLVVHPGRGGALSPSAADGVPAPALPTVTG